MAIPNREAVGAGASSPRGAASATPRASDPYRVMLVDDSVVVRSLLTRILESDAAVQVVASLSNGEQAVNLVKRHNPDVVVLDIEMPVMDGLTALPKLIQAIPGLKVIMASTLTRRNADISMKALAAGASDYIAKPEASREIGGESDFKRELLEKVRVLGDAARGHRAGATRVRPGGAPKPMAPHVKPTDLLNAAPRPEAPFSLRPISPYRPKVLAIGSSTGGPKALFTVLSGLDKSFDLPVLVTQHMPPTFTAILAEHIASVASLPCVEAKAGDVVKGGHIYVAPGDYHMRVTSSNGNVVVVLDQAARENFCRPAVDPMLRSIVEIYGRTTLAVILTGMGQDGLKGCEEVARAGGTILTQDAETSVVWGMPGIVSTAGLSSAVLPINKVADYVQGLASGAKR